jgi:hypothetical protein
MKIAAVLLIIRGVGPIPGIIGARIRIKSIIAGLLEDFSDLKTFFCVTALFFKILAREPSLTPVLDVALYAVSEGHGEIISGSLLDRLYDLDGETESPL